MILETDPERILWYCAYGPNDRLLASVGVHVDDPDALRDNPFPPEIPIQNIVLSEYSRDQYEHGEV